MTPVIQQRGFQTAADIVDSGTASSAEQPLTFPVGAQGGLSRELSEDRLPLASASSLAIQVHISCLDVSGFVYHPLQVINAPIFPSAQEC